MSANQADRQAFGLGLDLDSARTLVVALSGDWRTRHGLPQTARIEAALTGEPSPYRLAFDTDRLGDWDSALVSFLMRVVELAGAHGVEVDRQNLPGGARRLLDLALAVPDTSDAGAEPKPKSLVSRLGGRTLRGFAGSGELIGFIGEVTLMLGRFVTGRASYRRSEFVLMIQECGAQALPIVTVISLLMGLILAFVGAVQLQQFGAGIYVADLVGIAVTREMGAVMTGIVMAGRTGAAFAAQIAAMQGNEEIDALNTLGLSSIDFLVLPRMLALILMMPLLCVYADLVGIVGGWLVGIGLLDLTSVSYWNETRASLGLTSVGIGVFKSAVFGAIVAVAGCLRGLQAGRNAAAVGTAATSAVVSAILGIIVADAGFAVLTNVLGL